jgi:hypothetical protein
MHVREAVQKRRHFRFSRRVRSRQSVAVFSLSFGVPVWQTNQPRNLMGNQ